MVNKKSWAEERSSTLRGKSSHLAMEKDKITRWKLFGPIFFKN